ncbi:hypothetical protein LLG39_11245 [bacterium]|nr:hypothetical protein [bacterium]
MAESKADGAIIHHSSTKNIDALYNLRDSGIPMAFIDEYIDGMGIGYVSTDNYAGAYEVSSKLIEMGYEKIFYVTRGDKNVPIIERDRGYADAMRDLNIQPDIIATFHHLVAYEEGTRDLYRKIVSQMI